MPSFGVEYVEYQGLTLRGVIVCPSREVRTTTTKVLNYRDEVAFSSTAFMRSFVKTLQRFQKCL
jgi:hypothetical protein